MFEDWGSKQEVQGLRVGRRHEMKYAILLLSFFVVARSQEPHWLSSDGPPGGGVLCCAVSGKTILIGCLVDGAYRMPLRGTAWERTSVSGTDITALIALDDATFLAASRRDGLLRTTDHGASWTRTGDGIPHLEIKAFWKASSTLLAGLSSATSTTHMIYHSSDAGFSWTASSIQNGLSRTIFAFASAKSASDTIFAANGSLLRSTDRGVSWSEVATTFQNDLRFLSVNARGHLLAASRKNIRISTDGGQEWKEVEKHFGNVHGVALTNDDRIVIASKTELYSTTDAGETWNPPGAYYFYSSYINKLERLNHTDSLVVCSVSGVAIHVDEHQGWQLRNDSLQINDVLSVATNSLGAVLAVSSDWPNTGRNYMKSTGMYRLKSGEQKWQKLILDSSISLHSEIITDRKGNWYISNWRKLYRSEDGGDNWTIMIQDSSMEYYRPYMKKVYITPVATCLVQYVYPGSRSYPSTSALHRLSDGGTTWSRIKSFEYAYNLTFTTTHTGTLLMGTSQYLNRGVYRSTDDGKTWVQTGLLFTGVTSLVTAVAGQLFASTELGIYRSTDDGVTWHIRDSLAASSLVATPSGMLVATTIEDGRVLRSSDGGISWSDYSHGMLAFGVTALACDPRGRIFAGTRGGGVYASASTFTSAEEISGSVPDFISLSNYPNPFNTQTHIQFSLVGRTPVTLDIFNLVGQRVSVLAEEQSFERGSHSVVWNANGMPAGVYFARLRIAGRPPAVRKVLLIN